MKIPVLYAVHSGELYGTERMAIATLEAISSDFDGVLLAPPGPAAEEARRRGLGAETFSGVRGLAAVLARRLARSPKAAFVSTSVVHSAVFESLDLVFHRARGHLHVVHGGADERLSYARKRWLPERVKLIAVSTFVRERLAAHGVPEQRVAVIENFLAPSHRSAFAHRTRLRPPGERIAVVVSRADPIKRLDLLLLALERRPDVGKLQVRVLGAGPDLERLRARAAESGVPVTFSGFDPCVAEALAGADFLLHTCPAEPFGLSILEAFAAGLPVLVPDRGGAGALVEHGRTGFHYRGEDAASLAEALETLERAPSALLDRVAAAGTALLDDRFCASARGADYTRVLREALR